MACFRVLALTLSLQACCVAYCERVAAPSSNSTGMNWLWGTPILATVDMKAMKSNAAVAAHMRQLAATESPEIRSNRNGAWQSRNKAFLVPESHSGSAPELRKHIKTIRGAVRRGLRQYLLEHLQATGPGAEALLQNYEITIDASWANVNPPCGLNGPHVHPFAAISGAYYLDCGGNATMEMPCAINLMDPRPSAPLAHLPAEIRDALDFGIDWTLSLWPGTLLIFPSWLTHWVASTGASNTRLSISFNAGVKARRPSVPAEDLSLDG